MLKKAQMPPKLRYRIRRWLQQMKSTNVSPQQAQQIITQKFEEAVALKTLQKNQVMATLYKNNALRLDFGSNVSEKAKKAALDWAKKKGLKIETTELAKSLDKSNKLIFGDASMSECIKRIVWDC
jgi:hypothetical protein